MSFYMFQFSYKDTALKVLVDHPQDRSEAAARVIEAHGGKLHSFFFAFGDYDGVAISEFPDNESVTAAVLTVAASGAVASIKTTVLITPEEAVGAMRRAGSVESGYAAPTR